MKKQNLLFTAKSIRRMLLACTLMLLPTMASAQCPDNNHPHMIDLGLPSGTKWACCNVGARTPEAYGNYYAWGETQPKDDYNLSTYIHCDESEETCHDIGTDIAGTQYDAAMTNWGSPWVMPNKEQMEELTNNCSSEWTTENDVNGRRFTGSNGASIFLPAAGNCWGNELWNASWAGLYWLSMLYESDTNYGWYLGVGSGEDVYATRYERFNGLSVRPVVAGSSTPTGNIDFADDAVKALCVANWDTNGDGELSYAEAAAVTDLGNIFSDNQEIKKFNELQYFTGLTSIGERAFDWCTGLTSVIIPNSVTNIGFGAFRDCSSLTSVTIPDNVSSIDTYAFMSCERLTSVTIPNNVTSIGSEAFSGCSGLTSIKVESGNTKYDSRNNCNAIIETNTNILITGCMNTIIPNSVTTIGDFAFYYCSGLTSANIPNSVTSIGTRAFEGCTGLTSVTIPNSVTSIGMSAFQYCTGLTSVTIPNSVTSIGRSIFYWCTGLTEVISLIEEPWGIDERTFMCYDETGESYYPASTLYVPAGTKEKYEATAGWNKFKNIVEMGVPSGNIDFADPAVKAFCVANWDTDGDGELSKAEAAAVTDLGTVFKNNADITSFDELQYFTGLTGIETWAFAGSGLTSIIIPRSVISIAETAFNSCSNLASIKVESGNAKYDSRDDCNAIIETETNTLVVGCMNTVIPNSVTSIGDRAFFNCTGLESITIPNSVTYISGAFYGSGLTSVTIPNSVTTVDTWAFGYCRNLATVHFGNSVTKIGDMAFYLCDALTSVTIPSSVTSIGSNAFGNCSSLASIIVETGNTKYDSRDDCNAIIETETNKLIRGCMNTIIPNSVTSIGWNALSGNCPVSVTIPKSVTFIEEYAFGSSTTEFRSLITEPFEISPNCWYSVNTDEIPLYVPAGTKEKYEATAGWNVFKNIVEMDMAPIENGETINIGDEIDENTNLDGNVVDNVFVNISNGDGGFDPVEGCLIVSKPTDDSAINGKDIFGDDFKDNYTGIVFKVNEGKGSIKVEAKTQGNMVLKVKIGNSDPIEMELDGKLKVTFPYNVSEETLVYIYGGMSTAGAKATGGTRASADAGLLKIYGFEIVSDASGIEATESGLPADEDAPVYNLNGQRVDSPTKGIYIKNGRKVLVK